MDTIETVASSEISAQDCGIKKKLPVIKETVKEAPTPVVVQPPHTSPKPSFASEVRVHRKLFKPKKKTKK